MSNAAHDDQMKRSEGLQGDGNGDGKDTIENEKTEKPAIKYENEQRPGLSSSNGSKTAAEKKEEEKPKLSKLKTYWGKLGLDIGTLLMMFKGSLPPVIGIALYQADSFAKLFSTLGYLVPIITVLCIVIMPRAKYFQTIILNTIGICIGSAIALLGIWSGVQARKHTTPAGSTAIYNSSQSAVCAIWLFANIYVVNTLRAKLPALQFPVIMYSIFTNVAFTYGPLFSTIAAGETLIRELLLGFLTAYGIATAVHLFIMPMSSRTVVFKEQAGYIGLVRGTIKATTAYIQSLESTDMFADEKDNSTNEDSDGKSKSKPKDKQGGHPSQTPQALALKGSIAALTGLHGKIYGDIPFAKREMTWGKLDAKDLDEIFTLFRAILIPLCGMGTITDIFERIAERRGWIKSATKSQFDKLEAWEHCPDEEKAREKQLWNDIVKTLHEPFLIVTQAMDEGMEHAGLALEILPKPKKKKGEDVEAAEGTEIKPGDPEFAKYLDQKMKNFYGQRGETLKTWAREKGLSEEAFDSANNLPVDAENITADAAQHRRDQQQLYLILYMEYLLFSTGVAILDLVRFADTKVASGSMKKTHFIFPGKRRLKKWLLSIGSEDSAADHETPDSMEAGSHNIYMGAGFNPKKDPEHLPPATAWQRFGNVVRTIPRFLGSAESAFGFRVACATMSIGIVAYLEASYAFFMEQRLVWAMFMIAIGMTMTSGQSIFGFFGRIAGTFLAAVFSLVIYYIVDGKTAGVIVMLWLFIFIEMYFFLKFPRFITITLICVVTQVLIIGYELQVRKIGIAASTASGQPYYPTYKLAPYRLACVAGGSFVAFIWTIFPYPLTDRSWLRKDLGQTLYLLANYYSVVHTTIGARMHNTEGDMDLKSSPGRRLQKVRHYIFGKLLLLLPSLQQHADWQKWEPTIGGKFPRESYDGITLRAKNIMNYLSLISYATMTWSRTNASGKEMEEENVSQAEWLRDLSRLIDSIGPTSHHVTSTLSLLSASVTTGTALPPYISIPKPYQLSERLEQLDSGILGSRHVQEPGYSAYAVMQVASSLITDDLERLANHVKELVGETDFSFKVMMSDISMNSSEDGKGKRD